MTKTGVIPLRVWLEKLKNTSLKVSIFRRLDRLKDGNFGDYKSCGKGVFELRIDIGPGYRVYYGRKGNEMVLLLAGGTKKSQQKDIETAIKYWNDYLERED